MARNYRERFMYAAQGTLFCLACSAQSGGEGGGGALPSPEVATSAGGPATESPSATPSEPVGADGTSSEEIIEPLSGGAPSGKGPSSGTGACSLAILGDPGDNPGANFADWIHERGPVVDRYSIGPELEGLSSADLAHYQVVLLDKLPQAAAVGVAPTELASWVEQGGRVIALSGYGDYPEAVQTQNDLLAPLNMGFVSETPVWGPVSQFEPHLITSGLTTLTFVGGREVMHDPTDETIMTINDAPVGVVAVRGSGKLFLFGDEWVTFDSEWTSMPEIEQFWVNVFEWLGGCKLTPISMIK